MPQVSGPTEENVTAWRSRGAGCHQCLDVQLVSGLRRAVSVWGEVQRPSDEPLLPCPTTGSRLAGAADAADAVTPGCCRMEGTVIGDVCVRCLSRSDLSGCPISSAVG
jgi:hypothetical protein